MSYFSKSVVTNYPRKLGAPPRRSQIVGGGGGVWRAGDNF